MSGEKGKHAPVLVPMPNPSAGSTNPAASLSSLWGYIQPALDHIVRSVSHDTSKAPAIDVGYHMGIHTATYNYFSTQSEHASADKVSTSGIDLYEQLDKYYAEVARDLLLGAPQDDSALIQYIITCFHRYSVGAYAVNRLLNYVNRHIVRRAVEENRGWLHLNDMITNVVRTITTEDENSKERRTEELKQWGYVDGGSATLIAEAEACAEAASPLDHIVPVSSLALRRLRVEFFEPLLAVPKVKGRAKVKNKKPLLVNGGKMGPKGRLARAAKTLLELEGRDEEERRKVAEELANALRMVGIRAEHPLRKKLDTFVAQT